ncbi:uncharacterized protein LOC119987096 [Tripterygium wilfordii]|uniref:uncharacterized protein LOC119987096 n=1 Tax=Tripterygium wilfordii TaxID=458696 RepID=UPI0018F864A6|nr:uncharacterized protein LOC119987096 [Tripterygium wilfordii]
MSLEVDERTVRSDSKSVAWYWVIEHFSTLKHIDASILRELMEPAPEIRDEELGAKTREAVALRCLEELFHPLPDPAAVDAQANGHFDVSRSCEEVLKYILRRAAISELKSGAPESLKIRAIPFIIHKRASMGQTALSKLKDELVRGTLPFAASLSKGGRLVLANEHDKDDALALTWRCPGKANADAQVSDVQERMMDTNLDDVDGNADAQVPKVQESLMATALDNVDGNADAQVSMVQESLIATAHDNMDGDADVQVSKVQEMHNADVQVSIVKESLIATTHGNMDGNADVQVSEAQEIHNVVVEDSTVQESLIATTRDNVDCIADVQVSKPQEICNADAPVSVVQECLIATIHDNADVQISKAQESLFYTSFEDANGNADAQVAEAEVSLIATTLDNVDGDANDQVSKA